MIDPLSATALMQHVLVLAGDIGPRPAGHAEEAQAREYICRQLAGYGIADVTATPFHSPDTWGYALILPAVAAIAGNALGRKRVGKTLGALTGIASIYSLLQVMWAQRSPFAFLMPKRPSGNIIARLPASSERRQTLVLLGHTDSNKHRLTFAPAIRRYLLGYSTSAIAILAINILAQLAQALGAGSTAERIRRASQWGMVGGLLSVLADEREGYVAGANDNATAVACVLGLGAQVQHNPLPHTEVWLAFTGAEEVGCLGTHHLLDTYGQELADAWFIDFEMVGTPQVAYLTRHSGLSYFSTYTPDSESVALAEETARRHPELEVTGRAMTITEEVGALRGRGYRGLCLAGIDDGGWLANWHQYSDVVENIRPGGMERAARFALAMMQTLDQKP